MVAASTYFINVHAIPMFLMGIVTLTLGLLVYRSNKQSPAHRHFLVLCASIALWLDATSIALCSTDADTALRWFKLDNVGVMYISVAFYGFSAEFDLDWICPRDAHGLGRPVSSGLCPRGAPILVGIFPAMGTGKRAILPHFLLLHGRRVQGLLSYVSDRHNSY